MIGLLPDTLAFLWFVTDHPRLPMPARQAIETATVAGVSIASAWELAIKVGKGQIGLSIPLEELFGREREVVGIAVALDRVGRSDTLDESATRKPWGPVRSTALLAGTDEALAMGQFRRIDGWLRR